MESRTFRHRAGAGVNSGTSLEIIPLTFSEMGNAQGRRLGFHSRDCAPRECKHKHVRMFVLRLPGREGFGSKSVPTGAEVG